MEEWKEKDEAVLVRALEKRRGLSTNRATSPAMWRPTGASGVRGRSGGGLARGEEGGEEPGHDAWKATASRRWPATLLSGGGAVLRRWQRKAEIERGGRRELDYFAISKKFRGPTVKQK